MEQRISVDDMKVVAFVAGKEVYINLKDVFELKHAIDCNMSHKTIEIEEKI